MKKTAIILGATGLTGAYLLDRLLASDDYDKVRVFTRTPTGNSHAKLEEMVCNLLELKGYADKFYADEVFCCIGTTKSKTPDKKQYYDIDYGIPVAAAEMAEKNNITTFSVISAIGANKNSRFFYSRTKGEMEQAVLKCNIPNILIYRPSLIYGSRQELRRMENMGIIVFKRLQALSFGRLKNYRPVHAKELADALYYGAKHKTGRQIIFRNAFDTKQSA